MGASLVGGRREEFSFNQPPIPPWFVTQRDAAVLSARSESSESLAFWAQGVVKCYNVLETGKKCYNVLDTETKKIHDCNFYSAQTRS